MVTLGKMIIDIEKNCRILVSLINEYIILFVLIVIFIFCMLMIKVD